MRLAVLMIVGAGEADRHLARTLESARAWCDLLLVYGDGPDPETHALIERHAHRCRIAARSQWTEGEHLVRNAAFELADDTLAVGDVVLVLDADEVVAGDAAATRARLLALEGGWRSFLVHFRHLWAPDGSVHRVDGLWQPSVGPRIYRHEPGLRVAPLGGWVCPPLPALAPVFPQPVLQIDHWGYALPADRPRKHERYRRLSGHHEGHVASILDEYPVLAAVIDPEPKEDPKGRPWPAAITPNLVGGLLRSPTLG